MAFSDYSGFAAAQSVEPSVDHLLGAARSEHEPSVFSPEPHAANLIDAAWRGLEEATPQFARLLVDRERVPGPLASCVRLATRTAISPCEGVTFAPELLSRGLTGGELVVIFRTALNEQRVHFFDPAVNVGDATLKSLAKRFR